MLCTLKGLLKFARGNEFGTGRIPFLGGEMLNSVRIRRISSTSEAILLAMMLLGAAKMSRLNAQVTTATILGTVMDASGAAIPDSAIEVRNVGTGATQSTVSDSEGRYRVSDLGIGDYEVRSSKEGFASVVRKGIILTV